MDKHSDHIAKQAAEFFIRRHRASLSERRERDAWLDEDPRHAKAYSEFQQLWSHMGDFAQDPQLQALKISDLAASARRPWARPNRILALAASVLMLIAASYLVTTLSRQQKSVNYATAVGERRTEVLLDRTEIVLNTDSVLEVLYSKDRRAIQLKRGEAQFNVAHDASRPFVVSIGRDSVKALGTNFQVRKDSNSTIVTLLEGSVEIARGEERYVLRPNERAVLSERTGIAITLIDPGSTTGWLDGWLRFRGVPLDEVIAEANRYSEVKLRLGDPRIANVKLSGTFHAGDNASLAAAASLILPVRINSQGTEIVLLPK